MPARASVCRAGSWSLVDTRVYPINSAIAEIVPAAVDDTGCETLIPDTGFGRASPSLPSPAVTVPLMVVFGRGAQLVARAAAEIARAAASTPAIIHASSRGHRFASLDLPVSPEECGLGSLPA